MPRFSYKGFETVSLPSRSSRSHGFDPSTMEIFRRRYMIAAMAIMAARSTAALMAPAVATVATGKVIGSSTTVTVVTGQEVA